MDKKTAAQTTLSPASKNAGADARAEAARLMGSVKSEAKAEKARENGKLGGRPKGTAQSPETRARIAEGVRSRAAERRAEKATQ